MHEPSPETVRELLLAQGYVVPDDELTEITARFNALVDELTKLDSETLSMHEPWSAPIWLQDSNG